MFELESLMAPRPSFAHTYINRTKMNRKKKHSSVLERVSVITSGSPAAAAMPHSTLHDRATPTKWSSRQERKVRTYSRLLGSVSKYAI